MPLARLLYRGRTIVSGVVALIFIVVSHLTTPLFRQILISLLLLTIGIGVRLIAFNYIGAKIVSSEPVIDYLTVCGPYRVIRHPLYAAAILIYASFTLKSVSLYTLVLLLLVSSYYYFLAIYEEQFLARRYSDYAEYMKMVPRFFPKGKLYPSNSKCKTLPTGYGIVVYMKSLLKYEFGPIFAIITWLLIR